MELELNINGPDLKKVESRFTDDVPASDLLRPLTLGSSNRLDQEKMQTLNWHPMEKSWPTLSGAIVDDWNTILTFCSTPLVLELPDRKQCRCRLHPDLKLDARPDFRPELILKITAGRHRMELGVQHSAAISMLDDPNAGLLPLEIKCAIVEGCLDGPLSLLEQFGGPVSVADVVFNPVEIDPLNCLFEWQLVAEPGAVTSRAYLGTDASGLKWLAELFTKIDHDTRDTEKAWTDALMLPMALRFGSKRLTPSQIAQLDVLDILVLGISTAETSDWGLSVYVSGSVFCSGKLRFSDRSFTITEIVRQDMQNDNVDQNPEDKAQDTSQDETEPDVETRLDELDVEMIFEIGRRYISLGDLKKMTPGYVINLSVDIDEPVQVFVGDHHFATGQFVQVDNHVGVRLLKIKHKKGPHV